MEKTIQELLQQSIWDNQDRFAIKQGCDIVSYKELSKKIYNLISILLENGVKPHQHIGIRINDKILNIFSLISILNIRCSFVPINTKIPIQQLDAMLKHLDIDYLLTDNADDIVDIKLNSKIILLNRDLKETAYCKIPIEYREYDANDRIYLYHTSGTGGNAKAVIGCNKSLVHYIQWEKDILSCAERWQVSQLINPHFDAYLRDVFLPLLAGGTIVIPQGDEVKLDSIALTNWVELNHIEIIHLTPSLFRILNHSILTSDNFKELKYILLSGEIIFPAELNNWYTTFGNRIQLINLYGSTETTMTKLFYFIQPDDCKLKRIPVGKPMGGTKAIIVKDDMKPCEIGETGEILVKTMYGTLGYYKDNHLTQEKFIFNDLNTVNHELVYKTGDQGRMLEDGNIELIGRMDRVVKLRGVRIDLNEIESIILEDNTIRQCAVTIINKSLGKSAYKVDYCIKCGLPSTYTKVELDDIGLCNICKTYEVYKNEYMKYFGNMSQLEHLFKNNIKMGNYDCMLLYSGGKDSTYAMLKLKQMGLNILAVTFDNGYISHLALENIKSITNNLQIDLKIISIENMNEIFLHGLLTDKNVCYGCFKVLNIMSIILANDLKIPYIVTGLSRGQILDTKLYPIYEQNIFNEEEIKEKLKEQQLLYLTKNDYIIENLSKKYIIYKFILDSVHFIDFYRYTDVSKKEIMQFLKENEPNWIHPTDTGACSSNCTINDAGIYLQHKSQYYDNYTFANSWEVRLGHITLEDIDFDPAGGIDIKRVASLLDKIGYSDNRIPHEYNDSYLVAYYVADKSLTDAKIINHLKTKLPINMIPAKFIQLDKLPQSDNGKTAYNLLPDPINFKSANLVPPRNETEKMLAEIWKLVLKIEEIGIYNNFFELGGHSINIMQVISLLKEKANREISVKDFLDHSNIYSLSEFLEQNVVNEYE